MNFYELDTRIIYKTTLILLKEMKSYTLLLNFSILFSIFTNNSSIIYILKTIVQ